MVVGGGGRNGTPGCYSISFRTRKNDSLSFRVEVGMLSLAYGFPAKTATTDHRDLGGWWWWTHTELPSCYVPEILTIKPLVKSLFEFLMVSHIKS